MVVSNIDSLMGAEQMDLMENRMTRESFDRRFATHREKFTNILRTEVKKLLPGNAVTGDLLPKIGACELLIIKRQFKKL